MTNDDGMPELDGLAVSENRARRPGFFRISGLVGGVCSCLIAFSAGVPASAAQTEGGPLESTRPLVHVNGQPIWQRDVEREFSLVFGRGAFDEAERERLRQATLEKLIDRELVLQWLQQKDWAASDAEVALAVDRLLRNLAAREIPLQDHLRDNHLQEEDLPRVLKWQLSWEGFLDRYLTDENLQNYFQQHRRDFDGTELRVAHILLRLPAEALQADVDRRLAEAARLRARIVDEGLEFAEAAREFSESPTATEGGELGLIARRAPMPETFSKAAFDLEPGEISEPVRTAFGIHLIRCLEERPGQVRWEQVTGELRRAVARYLFTWAARQGRKNARIE